MHGAVRLRPRRAGGAYRVAHGPHGEVAGPVAVYVPDGGHRRTEIVQSGGQQRDHPRRALYCPVRVHKEDIDGAVVGGPRRQIVGPVAVHVPYAGDRISEPVAVAEVRAARRPVVYHRSTLCRPVGVEQHEVQGAPVGARGAGSRGRHGRVRSVRPDRNVRYAVPVQIPDGGHRRAEIVAVGQGRAAAGAARDLCNFVDRAVRVHQGHIDRAPVGPPRVVPVRAHRQVGHSVGVEIA